MSRVRSPSPAPSFNYRRGYCRPSRSSYCRIMANRLVLEVCVESLDHAAAAECGGAHRIELCTDLSCGGITPSPALMQTARRKLRIPIHVLVRPRAGDFCYSDGEFEIMRNALLPRRNLGMVGSGWGFLRAALVSTLNGQGIWLKWLPLAGDFS